MICTCVDSRTLVRCRNKGRLALGLDDQTAEDFFESFGEDYTAYDQAALWQLRNQVQEKMKNAVNRQTYIHRFMQLPVEDRFSWTTRYCFDIAYIFDVGEKYEKAISIGQKWITSTEVNNRNSLPSSSQAKWMLRKLKLMIRSVMLRSFPPSKKSMSNDRSP